MILDDCPRDCDSFRSLKFKINNRFPNLDESNETMMKAYNKFMFSAVVSCARSNAYCQQPSKKEERLRKYQEAVPNHDLGLGFFKN
ncbi:MAG: hypothetical protein RBT65_09260 [Methanolobus sp.]|nr:hypothetical protein [Methanolobus sp.]